MLPYISDRGRRGTRGYSPHAPLHQRQRKTRNEGILPSCSPASATEGDEERGDGPVMPPCLSDRGKRGTRGYSPRAPLHQNARRELGRNEGILPSGSPASATEENEERGDTPLARG